MYNQTTADEQTVIDKEFEKRIKDAESDGEKVTGRDKRKIWDEVIEDFKNGGIPVASILGDQAAKKLAKLLEVPNYPGLETSSEAQKKPSPKKQQLQFKAAPQQLLRKPETTSELKKAPPATQRTELPMGPENLARPGLPQGQKGFQKEATPPQQMQSPRLTSI